MREGARALVVLDMINPFDFEDGPRLLRQALPAARAHTASRQV